MGRWRQGCVGNPLPPDAPAGQGQRATADATESGLGIPWRNLGAWLALYAAATTVGVYLLISNLRGLLRDVTGRLRASG